MKSPNYQTQIQTYWDRNLEMKPRNLFKQVLKLILVQAKVWEPLPSDSWDPSPLNHLLNMNTTSHLSPRGDLRKPEEILPREKGPRREESQLAPLLLSQGIGIGRSETLSPVGSLPLRSQTNQRMENPLINLSNKLQRGFSPQDHKTCNTLTYSH